ncbi:transmembrane signal receptor [Lithospermum erythrorhizon]|uniref:non-specific serine/threonine protein kinase n=1 Tax=Lithospermum erythrorhizon TaxID=34254 RepID=A0AAV3PBK9_LITER
MVTNIMGHRLHYLWFFLIILNLLCFPGTALDLISSTKPLLNNQTLVSATNLFELGFFNPGNSDGTLAFDGNLVLEDQAACVVWTTNISSHAENRVVAKLMDTGNLVLYQENVDNSTPEKFLFQSFDYPTDTMLPGMKLGWDKKSGRNRNLTSWKKPDDPSSGDYTFMLDIDGYPGAYFKKNQEIIYRSGPWNGIGFSGIPEMMNTKSNIDFSFKMNVDEVSYMYELHNKSLYSRVLANSSGVLERYMWIPQTSRNWKLFWYSKKDQCDNYQECGAYGICDTDNSPVCKCMKGFRPKNPVAWFLRDGSDGCVKESKLDCQTDGFLKLSNMKLPESSVTFVDPRMSLDQCREICKRNCSCMGYTNSNISHGRSGCVIWSSNLMDMRQFAPSEGGQDLYIRAAASNLEQVKPLQLYSDHSRRSKQHIIVSGIVIASLVIPLGVSVISCILWRRKTRRVSEANSLSQGAQEKGRDSLSIEVHQTKSDNLTDNTSEDFELPLFDFNTIAVATNYFSVANRVGQGGFGVVYKGTLAEGELIAVKRLSENSGQGVEEFRNELKLIAKLQHRNLVRLKGCCVDMEEKMLIYEYMENRSLDSILFSHDKGSLLNWHTRFNIILGIAKGLVYLHQDSRKHKANCWNLGLYVS